MEGLLSLASLFAVVPALAAARRSIPIELFKHSAFSVPSIIAPGIPRVCFHASKEKISILLLHALILRIGQARKKFVRVFLFAIWTFALALFYCLAFICAF